MAPPLYVALVWHMHQPLYQDALTERYTLPWVRLHASKDYLHMAETLAQYPHVHATFNFVPSLVEQLDSYARGAAEDRFLALSRQDDWSPRERAFLLKHFFSIDWERFVRRYPAYERLLSLRDVAMENCEYFSRAYFRDLVAWFNLAWIDPGMVSRDPILCPLRDKRQGFGPQDVATILEKQLQITRRVLPAYRELEAAGQVELSTSPYHHPILPLLIDGRSALEASPRMHLPATPFRHPEDAREQMRQAIASHVAHFGRPPHGLWPSEGAVSQATLDMLSEVQGLQWVASDEGILERSLGRWVERDGSGHVLNPELLYQPYRVGRLSMIFRDRVLSDRIGFVYQHMDGAAAARDLVDRLLHIRRQLRHHGRPYLVSIILDGENCWETYPDNGDPFLHALYQSLSEAPGLQAVTVSEYLDAHPPREDIARLACGSWINANLETWIGEPAQNRAWEALAQVRGRLLAWQQEHPQTDPETLARAWREVHIAESSDWFWWYCHHNRPAGENPFDLEFRRHLGNVYRTLGLPVPGWLGTAIPLCGGEWSHPPRTHITPPLNAAPAAEGWAEAGYCEARPAGGSMQRGHTLLHGLRYGNDRHSLYLRLEANEPLAGYDVGVYLSLPHGGQGNRLPRRALAGTGLEWPALNHHRLVEVKAGSGEGRLLCAADQERWQPLQSASIAQSDTILELSVPLTDLGVACGEQVCLVLSLAQDGVICQLVPPAGPLSVKLLGA